MTGPINVVLSTNALKIKNRFILLASLGVIGTLLAVRRTRPAQVLSVKVRAESVMRVQTLRRVYDLKGARGPWWQGQAEACPTSL